MFAHFSLSHLFDPEVALVWGGLLLLYVLWRSVPYFQTQTVPNPSLKQDR